MASYFFLTRNTHTQSQMNLNLYDMGESALGNNSPITMNLGTEHLITQTSTKGNRKNVK